MKERRDRPIGFTVDVYPQYPDPVSIEEIEQVYLEDPDMFLVTTLPNEWEVQVFHMDKDDEEYDEEIENGHQCKNFLGIGGNEEEDGLHFVSWSMSYTLADVLRCLGISREERVWLVDADIPRQETGEEMHARGASHEEIASVLKN